MTDEWRPISTVPPSQEVLLTNGEVCLTGSTDEDRLWFHLATPDHPYNALVTKDWRPTHWMPLPAPPKQEARND